MTTVRRATSDDAARLNQIAEQAYAPYVQRLNGQRPAPMDADYGAIVTEPGAWVTEVQGEVVGFLILVPESSAMLVDSVAVSPSRQGSGVGRLLMRLAESEARAAGYDHVRLYTNVAMVENQSFYERNGYVETHRAREQGFDRVFYLKVLS